MDQKEWAAQNPVLIRENFANLGLLPPFCHPTTLPLKIEAGSGSPLRAVAEVA